jgi:hypothetical protein
MIVARQFIACVAQLQIRPEGNGVMSRFQSSKFVDAITLASESEHL